MKKVALFFALAYFCLLFTGCAQKETGDNSANDSVVSVSSVLESSKAADTSQTEYAPGETVLVETADGTYNLTVEEAKILPPFQEERGEVYQVTWVYQNVDCPSFEMSLEPGVGTDALTVKDAQGFVLTKMSVSWQDDSIYPEAVNPGESFRAKQTYVIENPDTEYLQVSTDRLNEKGSYYKIPLE